jgi:fructose-bisphosphate aldolase class 1
MMSHDLESNAATLVTHGKAIPAADETVPTLTRRFDALGIPSTEQSRRTQPAPGLLTARRLSGSIRMRWRQHCSESMIHRIAETGATTNAHAARGRNAQLDEIGFRGGDDGKHAV